MRRRRWCRTATSNRSVAATSRGVRRHRFGAFVTLVERGPELPRRPPAMAAPHGRRTPTTPQTTPPNRDPRSGEPHRRGANSCSHACRHARRACVLCSRVLAARKRRFGIAQVLGAAALVGCPSALSRASTSLRRVLAILGEGLLCLPPCAGRTWTSLARRAYARRHRVPGLAGVDRDLAAQTHRVMGHLLGACSRSRCDVDGVESHRTSDPSRRCTRVRILLGIGMLRC